MESAEEENYEEALCCLLVKVSNMEASISLILPEDHVVILLLSCRKRSGTIYNSLLHTHFFLSLSLSLSLTNPLLISLSLTLSHTHSLSLPACSSFLHCILKLNFVTFPLLSICLLLQPSSDHSPFTHAPFYFLTLTLTVTEEVQALREVSEEMIGTEICTLRDRVMEDKA